MRQRVMRKERKSDERAREKTCHAFSLLQLMQLRRSFSCTTVASDSDNKRGSLREKSNKAFNSLHSYTLCGLREIKDSYLIRIRGARTVRAS